MPIQNVVINTADVDRSVEFYTTFLEARVVGDSTPAGAILDLVTATIELRATTVPAEDSTYSTNDLQQGFRHIGFKVDKVDPRVETLKGAGVPFHLDPLDAEGGVRIAFFFDPDGTLLELVEGDLQYHTIMDQEGVSRERALGVPTRPRFDHIAVTVDDRMATDAFYSQHFGFSFIGTIDQPRDPRGFRIGFLKSDDTVLEIFTYVSDKQARHPQLDAPGFSHAQLGGDQIDGLSPVGHDDRAGPVYADNDGFTFSVAQA